MHAKEDKRAVRAVLRGDKARFRELVERYEGPLYNLMLRTVRCVDDAADLTQDAFVKAFERLHTFDERRDFFPWLYAVGINTARDWLRKNARRNHVEFREEMAGFIGDVTHKQAMLSLDGEGVMEALRMVPLGQREALLLRFRGEMSMREIADVLGISESGAKMRIQRGLESMRSLLGEKS